MGSTLSSAQIPFRGVCGSPVFLGRSDALIAAVPIRQRADASTSGLADAISSRRKAVPQGDRRGLVLPELGKLYMPRTGGGGGLLFAVASKASDSAT